MHYELIERRDTAAALHALDLPDPVVPQLWQHEITAPALVLGSAQRDPALVDHHACVAAGVDVVRRRSGGGAVLLLPGEVGWLDVILPAGAPGWAADVHAPMHWIGRHLAAVFGEVLDGAPLTVNHAGMVPTAWSALVCFDGFGPGEVAVGGAKLVGISQRRTRAGARLQCSWYHAYDPAALVALLAPERRPPVDELQPVATIEQARAAEVPGRLLARLRAEQAGHAGQAEHGDVGGARGAFGEEMGNNG